MSGKSKRNLDRKDTGHKIKLLKCATDVEEGRKVADYIVELKIGII